VNQDLNIRLEILKQYQEVVGNILEYIGIGNDFLSRTQKAQHLRERMNKWDCIKLKSFLTAKETVTRLSYSSNKGLISRIYKELKKLNPQRINTPMKNWAHELNREFPKEEVQMASKYMKKCSTSLVIKEMLKFHLIPVRMAIIKGNDSSKC
jgi:hypothetical protein